MSNKMIKKVNRVIADAVVSKEKDMLRIAKVDDKIYITPDGLCLFIFTEEDFIFDFDKIKNDRPWEASKLTKSKFELAEAKPTGDIKVTDGKIRCIKLASENSCTYINEKLLNDFGRDFDMYINENEKASPLYMFDDDIMVRLIMPVRVKDNL